MTGADNQQERLSCDESARWFLAGFIEGEGSLAVSIKKHPSRFGFIASPEFFLYQHESGRPLLELAREVFGNGSIAPKPGTPQVLVFRVASRKVLLEQVIPFFERYVVPFTCKGAMFRGFREIVQAMSRKEHLTPDGLVRVIEIAYTMNPNSKGRERLRTFSELRERILRGHTSDIPLVRG